MVLTYDPSGYYKNKQTNKKPLYAVFTVVQYCMFFIYYVNTIVMFPIFFFSFTTKPKYNCLIQEEQSMNFYELIEQWSVFSLKGVVSVWLLLCLSSSLDKNRMFYCMVGFRSINLFSVFFLHEFCSTVLSDLAISWIPF